MEEDAYVPRLDELIPDAEVLLALEPEELAGAILEVLNSSPSDVNNFLPGNFARSLFGLPEGPYPLEHQDAIRNALAEAFMWLEREGLIARNIESSSYGPGWHFVSRRGRGLTTREDVSRYRRASLLPKSLLHDRIAERCWMNFVRGEYDTAVFQAFKEVEIAVRQAGGYSDSDYGVDLMRRAFKIHDGPISDTLTERAE